MAIKKVENGWLADFQPAGRGGKRFRKTFKTKYEALAWEAWLKTQINQSPEWEPQKRDLRRLSNLIDLWFQHHGNQLRAGKDTYARLKALCAAMGDPYADSFKASDFTNYRATRIENGISANNLNREHAYLRAVFNELKRLDYWKNDNPLASLRQFKIIERELSFLSLEDIDKLLSCLNDDALLISKICLSTGARWSEIEQLKFSQVRDGMVHLSGTKSGKNRSIPITNEIISALKDKTKTSLNGRFFKNSYDAFRYGIESTGIQLPKGQLTHVLRHTFSSHFMMNGGNILVLQKILGHANLTMTMRYAHLAPEHLNEAKNLNPISRLTLG